MPWLSGSRPSAAWMYTRGREAVHIEVLDQGDGFALVVHGPGARRRFIECPNSWAVIETQIAEEAHLLALGYTLESYTTEHRTSPVRQRRSASRDSA